MTQHTHKNRDGESGNVLFLILIAVALFAALSYAVTQSSRSGGGDASKESNLIGSAQLTQYPAGVRTALVRMIIGGADVATLEFNNESMGATNNFSDCTSGYARCVFHPTGGAATYADAPKDLMAAGTPGTWVFNGENEINLIGTTAGSDAPTTATADIIAFLPDITLSVCQQVNTSLGISGVPTDTGINFATQMMNVDGSTATSLVGSGTTATIGEATTASSAGLDGEPYGCFQDTATSDYVYYHVLIER
ncbi:MAG: hypothetical protein KDJ15_02330 [Alphaproteobacteria bacterium]|nr:hypothetical protein [Alphaproteobacteria bacterium]